MLRQVLVAQACGTTWRFCRKANLAPITYCSVPFCWYNWDSNLGARAFSSENQPLLLNQYSLGGNLCHATEFSLSMSSLVLGHIIRKFHTLEAVQLQKKSDVDPSDCVNMVYKTVLDYSNPEYKMEEALDKLSIKPSTPLVVEVLDMFRFEEKLALRFFSWAGHQEYYDHESEAFNKMIDILSSTKYKVKQFRIVCDLLDYMKRNKKKSIPIDDLLTILRRYTEKHLTYLQKFAKKKKIRVKTQPEINAFNLLLDALCKCGLVEDAETMFNGVKVKVNPTADTYNILFFGWCRVRNPAKGMSLLQDMIDNGYSPENFTYNTAIDTFCKAGMVTEAAELLKFMKTKGSPCSSPTAKTYVIMMIALAQNDRMEEFFKMLADMKDCGYLPDVSTYKELVEGMLLAGKMDAAYKFLEEMGKTSYPPDIVSYNCFLKVLCDNKNSDEALQLFRKMIEVGCMPSVQTYMLITMFFRIGDPYSTFDAWHEMDRRGCERDDDTYCVMIDGLFGSSNIIDARFLLEQVIERGMKPYGKFDAFLMQLSKIGDLHAIHRLSEHMRKFYNPAMASHFSLNQKRKGISLRGI